MRAVAWIALLTLLLGCECFAPHDCNEGCPLGGAGVCGEDGVTYQNDCLAVCQKVKVVSAGRCGLQFQLLSRDVAFADAPAGGPLVPPKVINRYSSEGYRLIGKAETGDFEPTAAYIKGRRKTSAARTNSTTTLMSVESILPQHPPVIAGVRQTREGFVYYLTPSTTQSVFMSIKNTLMEASIEGQTTPGFLPKASGSHAADSDASGPNAAHATSLLLQQMTGRRLSSSSLRALRYIIGQDDRTEVVGARAWPVTAVGQFVYSKGSCSGVMIGPRSVLTAGHCVYSRKKKLWQQNMKFVPDRHREGNTIVEPYGRIPYESVTTYSGWVDNLNTTDSMRFDLAVVRLANDTIGYSVGWLGLSWDKAGFKGQIYSTGYPGDKMQGSQWQSTCDMSDEDGDDSRFVNSCDVWPGQSGSPMWEWRNQDQYYMRAVMTYESCKCCSDDCKCCSSYFNGGCAINALHYNSILNWS